MKITDAGARKLAARLGMPVRTLFPTAGRPKVAGGLIGYVDQIGPNFVRGWAADRDLPGTSLTLRVYLDDTLVAEGEASIYREDIQRAGHGGGRHGYQLSVPTKALFCAGHITIASVAASGGETVILRQALHDASLRTKPVVYLDASDLIEFMTHHRELSGIQRVQAGYLLALGDATVGDATCRVCTRFKHLNFFFEVPLAAFAKLLVDAGDHAGVAKGMWSDHVHRFKLGLTRRATIMPGDSVFTLGAPWALDQHNEIIRCVKLFYRAHYYQIFYDLIPISVPEVVPGPLIPHFARAMAAMATYADHVFSISDYSRRDLAETLAKLGRPVPETSVVPMGGSITDSDTKGSHKAGAVERLGVAVPYVLCVGTLEPRKNHALLFQVWRRLVARYGAANVPKLVLVGRVGWYMEDFMRMLKVTNRCDGTIVHLMGVSNAELAELYDNCLFTMFPSFSEGWGLPITESFAHGKVCVCSDLASMPEAGGTHAIYIDPFDTSAVFDLCDKLIHDGETLAAAERQLHATFKAQTWREASQGLQTQLAGLAARRARAAALDRQPVVLGRLYKFYNIEALEGGRHVGAGVWQLPRPGGCARPAGRLGLVRPRRELHLGLRTEGRDQPCSAARHLR